MFTCNVCRRAASCSCAFARLDRETGFGLCRVCAATAWGENAASVPLDVRLELQASAPAPPLHTFQSAGGIGDAVCGFYAAAGLAHATKRTVRYRTRHPAWLARTFFPSVLVVPFESPPAESETEPETDFSAPGYTLMLREECCRKQWYCDNVARALVLDSFAPQRPHLRRQGANDSGATTGADVLLFPLAAWPQRQWPLTHWRRLAGELERAGLRVAALGAEGQGEVLAAMWGDSDAHFRFYWGQSPDWVMSAMQSARCVVANDSGMAHVAGLLDVPCVAVHAQHAPATLFSLTNVRSAFATTPCAGCAWQSERGWDKACLAGCSALASVAPATVTNLVSKVIHHAYR